MHRWRSQRQLSNSADNPSRSPFSLSSSTSRPPRVAMAAFSGFDSASAQLPLGAGASAPGTPAFEAGSRAGDIAPPAPPPCPSVSAADPSRLLDFAAHHQVARKVVEALLRALGAEPEDFAHVLVADFGAMPESEALEAIGQATLEENRPLTAIQRGAAMRLWRAASAYVTLIGLGPNGPLAPTAASSSPTMPISTAPVAAPVTLKKCSDLVDQGCDLQFVPLAATEVNELRQKFEEKTGDEPEEAARPSADQLGALKCLLSAGKAPYVDLGLFGPFGDRTAKLRRFQAQVWVDGELTTKMIAGPRSFEAWKGSWEVFRASMIMLDAATIAGLDKYARGIERLYQIHGQWPMLLLADEKCRGEQWDILAEKFARSPPPGYSAEQPWRYIIPASAYGVTGPMAEWWYFNVVAPLTYKISTPLRWVAESEGSGGTTLERHRGGQAAALRPMGNQAQKRKAFTGKGGGQPSSSASSSTAQWQACNAWNKGGCSDPCSGGRRHVCVNCGGAHRATECGQAKGTKQDFANGKNGGGKKKKKSGGSSKNKKAGKGAGKGKPSA